MWVELGKTFFRFRDYTPIPLVIILLFIEKPTITSATFGTLMLVVGELLRIYSVAFIGAISRTRKDRTGGELITHGPFAIVRNPIYVGNFFISVGISVFGGVWWFALLTILLFPVQYVPIVKYEEHFLEKTFGDEFLTYKNKVPAWIPKKLISLSDIEWSSKASHYSVAIKSERRTFLAIGLMLLILIILA